MESKVHAFARIRPLPDSEKSEYEVKVTNSKEIIIASKEDARSFSFDDVFDIGTTQEEIYDVTIGSIIQDVISGINCTIVAYGPARSGKSYTMMGKKASLKHNAEAGLFSQALCDLFENVKTLDVEVTILASLVELKDHKISDLLNKSNSPKPVKAFDLANEGSIFLDGVIEKNICRESDIEEIIASAADAALTAKKHGHVIFFISVVQHSINSDYIQIMKIGRLNLVDLAGTGMCIGPSYLDETQEIDQSYVNQSILSFERVLDALKKEKSHIPYWDSNLTHILKYSFDRSSAISIIVTISSVAPLKSTLHTLASISQARSIKVSREICKKYLTPTIQDYAFEAQRLEQQLLIIKEKKDISMNLKEYRSMKLQKLSMKENIKSMRKQKETLTENRNEEEENLLQPQLKRAKIIELIKLEKQKWEDIQSKLGSIKKKTDSSKQVLKHKLQECGRLIYVTKSCTNTVEQIAVNVGKLKQKYNITSSNISALRERISQVNKILADENGKTKMCIQTLKQHLINIVREFEIEDQDKSMHINRLAQKFDFLLQNWSSECRLVHNKFEKYIDTYKQSYKIVIENIESESRSLEVRQKSILDVVKQIQIERLEAISQHSNQFQISSSTTLNLILDILKSLQYMKSFTTTEITELHIAVRCFNEELQEALNDVIISIDPLRKALGIQSELTLQIKADINAHHNQYILDMNEELMKIKASCTTMKNLTSRHKEFFETNHYQRESNISRLSMLCEDAVDCALRFQQRIPGISSAMNQSIPMFEKSTISLQNETEKIVGMCLETTSNQEKMIAVFSEADRKLNQKKIEIENALEVYKNKLLDSTKANVSVTQESIMGLSKSVKDLQYKLSQSEMELKHEINLNLVEVQPIASSLKQVAEIPCTILKDSKEIFNTFPESSLELSVPVFEYLHIDETELTPTISFHDQLKSLPDIKEEIEPLITRLVKEVEEKIMLRKNSDISGRPRQNNPFILPLPDCSIIDECHKSGRMRSGSYSSLRIRSLRKE